MGASLNFKDKDLELFWESPSSFPSRGIAPNLRRTLYRKLQILDAAFVLNDLRAPPGNRLEALKGKRKGQYSIRVNDRWRLCFSWKDREAQEVEFCDYRA